MRLPRRVAWMCACLVLALFAPGRAGAQSRLGVLPAGGYSQEAAFRTQYVAFGLLQLLDAQSTSRALASGAYETNAVLAGIANRPVALMATKTLVAAGTLTLMERVRKKHPRAALLTMMVMNSAYAVVVVRNSRIAQQGRMR